MRKPPQIKLSTDNLMTLTKALDVEPNAYAETSPLVFNTMILERGHRVSVDPQYYYALKVGCVGLYTLSASEDNEVVSICHRGELLGLNIPEGCTQSITAYQFTVAILVPRVCVEGSMCFDFFYKLVCRQNKEALRLRLTLEGKSMGQRLAFFLLDYSDRLRIAGLDWTTFHLHPYRGDIGRALGVSGEGASREFSILLRLGVVSVSENDAKIITIHKRDLLEEAAHGKTNLGKLDGIRQNLRAA